MKPLRHLDLFSGIGGFALGLQWAGGFETTGFCEIDPYCQAVLRKHWPDVPIHDDIRTLTADAVGPVDIITGGFPCQPYSAAGQRRGAEDDRHLWPEMARLVRECRPAWVIGENVAGLVSLGLDDVLSDLEDDGYACQTFDIPAVAVDAKHRRHRLWIVAYTSGAELREQPGRRDGPHRSSAPQLGQHGTQRPLADPSRHEPGRAHQRPLGKRAGQGGEPEPAADSSSQRRREDEFAFAGQASGEQATGQSAGSGETANVFWLPEPSVGRVAHGIPRRVDRLKGLGNAVVPQIPEILGRAINEVRAA